LNAIFFRVQKRNKNYIQDSVLINIYLYALLAVARAFVEREEVAAALDEEVFLAAVAFDEALRVDEEVFLAAVAFDEALRVDEEVFLAAVVFEEAAVEVAFFALVLVRVLRPPTAAVARTLAFDPPFFAEVLVDVFFVVFLTTFLVFLPPAANVGFSGLAAQAAAISSSVFPLYLDVWNTFVSSRSFLMFDMQ
jgi:hypothetical protein